MNINPTPVTPLDADELDAYEQAFGEIGSFSERTMLATIRSDRARIADLEAQLRVVRALVRELRNHADDLNAAIQEKQP